MKIGLLGGSFNPAHSGHLHISEQVIKKLQLDEVWWIISPQNPLKSSKDMAPYEKRLESAKQQISKNRNIKICEIEKQNKLQYTSDTIDLITRKYQNKHKFVWVMGADNLAQFDRWYNWRKILKTIPICVVDRAPHSHGSLRSKMALSFGKYRIFGNKSHSLAGADTPHWTYLFIARNKQSATAIRNKFGKNAFLR